jgi:proteic killer suppression protein
MIRNFRHRGLETFFRIGAVTGIRPSHAEKVRLVLARLQSATTPGDLRLPGLRLHKLTGDRNGQWSVRISGNWRITFGFDGPDAIDVNYEDYH